MIISAFLQHQLFNHSNKTIWNKCYAEEYYGLCDTPCWFTKSQHNFKMLLNSNLIPAMGTSAIKVGEHSKPKNSKYYVVIHG